MRGNSPTTAVNGYLGTLRRALSCISRAPVLASAYHVGDEPIGINLDRGRLAVLRGGFRPLALRFEQQFALVEDRIRPARERWTVALTAYWYTIFDQASQRELFAFHWHPGRERIDFPHLHLGSRILSEQALAGRHLPTGAIGVPDLLRFLIAEPGVAPERPDWEQVLTEAGAALTES